MGAALRVLQVELVGGTSVLHVRLAALPLRQLRQLVRSAPQEHGPGRAKQDVQSAPPARQLRAEALSVLFAKLVDLPLQRLQQSVQSALQASRR